MVDNKVVVNTVNGLDMYLYYSNNFVYITFQLYDSNMFDIFYTTHIPLQFEFNFNKETFVETEETNDLFMNMKIQFASQIMKSILTYVKSHRKIALPNPNFINQLCELLF